MGLFDKKFCDICGNKIGVLGNRKLEDGNLCKDCASKLSPFFSERRHSTIADIQAQLAYREENKKAVSSFYTTLTYGESGKLMIDENNRKFMISKTNNLTNENPDVVDFSQVTSCELDIDENRRELKRKDAQGNMVSYNPARYEYYYNFDLKLQVNHPYFDEMTLRLNRNAVETGERDMSGRNPSFRGGGVYANSARGAVVGGVLGALAGNQAQYSQGYSDYERYVQMGEEIRSVLMGGGRNIGGQVNNMNGGFGNNGYQNNQGWGNQNMAQGGFGNQGYNQQGYGNQGYGNQQGFGNQQGMFGNQPAGNVGAFGAGAGMDRSFNNQGFGQQGFNQQQGYNQNFNNQQGFNQQGFNQQQGYNQNFNNQQGGFNQQGYGQQQGFNQNFNNQQGFGNQNFNNQGGFNQQGFNQAPAQAAQGPVTCPVCGAKVVPDANGCCEF